MSTRIPLERKLDECLKQDRIPFNLTQEQAWKEVENKIGAANIIEMMPAKRPVLWRVAAAASIALLASTGLLYVLASTDFNTDNSTAQVELPDGSSIVMNAHSNVSFNRLAWIIEREVELSEGEAFFDVEKGSEFTVNTPHGTVAVLGTSFDVNIDGDYLIVGCKTGSVRVNDLSEKHPIVLSPGMQVAMSQTEQNTRTLAVESIDAWVSGEYSFQNVAISEVFEILQNRSGYGIELPENLDLSYTGQFSMNQPLKEIMQTICKPLNLDFNINEEEKVILITKK